MVKVEIRGGDIVEYNVAIGNMSSVCHSLRACLESACSARIQMVALGAIGAHPGAEYADQPYSQSTQELVYTKFTACAPAARCNDMAPILFQSGVQ